MIVSCIVVVIPLGFVVGYVIAEGHQRASDCGMVHRGHPGRRAARRAAACRPAIVGTLLITAGATVMAVPLGVLGAVYLNEYGGDGRLARLIRFMSDVMTGVPSIVMGLFIYTIWTLRFGLDRASAARSPSPASCCRS